MYKSYSMELAGRTLTVDVGRVAKQANGAVLMHYGDTTVLSTATASKEPREGIDFFPLSVEYEEKMYAVGKIPGGFNKREGIILSRIWGYDFEGDGSTVHTHIKNLRAKLPENIIKTIRGVGYRLEES